MRPLPGPRVFVDVHIGVEARVDPFDRVEMCAHQLLRIKSARIGAMLDLGRREPLQRSHIHGITFQSLLAPSPRVMAEIVH